MGFVDRAKKLAEQAQEKLDEAQKGFNQGQRTGGQEQGNAVRYDERGRPIQDAPPAGEAPPPSAEPAHSPPAGGADSNPDPLKPIE